ncbi:MAG: T9SS type A sorting domain-containing protein [Bacteroidales bacterium]|nr:T9SS type A sorting domain-containing protein [Bacteroidales bacterium]
MKRFINCLSAGILLLAMPCMLFSQQNTFTSVFYDPYGAVGGSGAVQSPDSTYLIAGEKDYIGLIIKMDPYGYNLWEKQYDFSGQISFFTRIFRTHDEQFITVGSLNYDYGNGDILCMKLDETGDTVWSRSINFGTHEYATYVQETSDHGFIISGCGSTSPYDPQMLVIKLDSAGNMQWGKTISGETNSIAHSVKEAPDGGFYVIGGTRNSTGWDTKALLVKLTAAGELEWSTQFVSGASSSDGYDVIVSNSGLICLIESSLGTLLVKTDLEANVLWSKGYWAGSSWSFYNHSQMPKLHQTADGGFAFSTSGQFGTLFRLDSSGLIEWYAELMVESSDVIETLDRGFLVVGNGPLMGVEMGPTFNPQIGMLKTDSLGNTDNCVFTGLGSADTTTVSFIPVTLTPGNGGTVEEMHPVISDPSIIRYSGCVAMTWSIDELEPENPQLIVSPNPSDGRMQISLVQETHVKVGVKIFNLTGSQVWSSPNDLQLPAQLDLSFLPNGIYFIMSESEGSVYTQRFIIIR